MALWLRGPWADAVPEARGEFEGDPDEVMAHQRGPVPVRLQVLWGLNELAVHHYDVTAPSGPGYRPPDAVLRLLTDLHERTGGRPDGDGAWDRTLRQTGRDGSA